MQPGGRDQACWKRKIRAFPWGQATGIHHLKFAHLVVTSSSASRCSARSCPHRSSSPPPTPTSTPHSSARSRPRHCSSSTIFCLIRAAIFDTLQKAQAAQGVGARGGACAAETYLNYAAPARIELGWGRACGARLWRHSGRDQGRRHPNGQPRFSSSPVVARGSGRGSSSSSPYSTMTLQLLLTPTICPPIK